MATKVLIVDDSKVMRMVIKKGLTEAGFACDIVEAGDGKEGLDKFSAENPQLVLSDWNMPNMNGCDMLREIRKLNASVPVIMVTTEGAEDKIGEAISAGANGYVCKPFTPDKLKEKLGGFIQ